MPEKKDILEIIEAARRFSETYCSEKNISMTFFGFKNEELEKAFRRLSLNEDEWIYRNCSDLTVGEYKRLTNPATHSKIDFTFLT